MLGDYDEVTQFTQEEIHQILEQAADFLNEAKEYLAKKS
jgi:uncharacterized protein (UPF0332 family)